MLSDASEYVRGIHGHRSIETGTDEGPTHRDTETEAADGETDQEIGCEYE